MQKLIKLLSANHLDEATHRARLNQAMPKDNELLGELSLHLVQIIEAKLIQLESLAKALQVACLDAGNSGIFEQKTDGFNFALWLQEEAKTLQTLAALQSDAGYFSNKAAGGDHV